MYSCILWERVGWSKHWQKLLTVCDELWAAHFQPWMVVLMVIIKPCCFNTVKVKCTQLVIWSLGLREKNWTKSELHITELESLSCLLRIYHKRQACLGRVRKTDRTGIRINLSSKIQTWLTDIFTCSNLISSIIVAYSTLAAYLAGRGGRNFAKPAACRKICGLAKAGPKKIASSPPIKLRLAGKTVIYT